MTEPKKFYYPMVASVLVVIGMAIGFSLRPKMDSRRASKFEEVLSALEEKYVDSIDKDALFNHAVNEMLHQLDPHTRYISQANLLKEQQEMMGSFGGIGVRFQRLNDTVCIISAMKNGPAYQAGMRSGDQVILINGKSFTGAKITNDQVMETLRGELNTKVKVKVLRNKQLLELVIKRGEIAIETVDSYFMLDAKTGYIKINQFSVPTPEEFKSAAKRLLSEGMNHLVLDLRGNPGGVLDAAVAIADEFLPKGATIVTVKGKSVPTYTSYAKEGGLMESIRLSVLVDESSASASEVLAGAIQDNDRGMLYGRRTYGKGLVQQDQVLRDGSSVRMTISRYYTPSGRTIQRPYKGGYESYMKDELRYREGELFNQDSIPKDKSQAFKTKKGRTVYGGGGIVPDVFVPLDSSEVSMLTSLLFTHQVFSGYVFKFLQTQPNPWNSVQALANYQFTDRQWGQFKRFASDQLRLEGVDLLISQEKQRLIPWIKEEFSRQLWQESNELRFRLGKDREITRAL